MKRIILAIVALMFIVQLVPAQTSTSSISSGKIQFYSSSDTRILVHYMPWYQTPSVSGYWGWHWTMNHFNPDSLDVTVIGKSLPTSILLLDPMIQGMRIS